MLAELLWGVSVEQDEGDASLRSRCGSVGTCSSRKEHPGTEKIRAALLGGSRKKGENKSPGFGRRRC